jgi:HEAT repeat protein
MKAIDLCAAALILLSGSVFATPLYTLVQGADQFRGSISAWHLLEQNGFVVTDPDYSEMDEAYKDLSMPLYITPDSAWDIFQYFAAGGIRGLETNSPAAAKLFGSITEPATKTGLELFVSCPELRSTAAVHAYQNEFGEPALQRVETVNYTIEGDSLAAQSLRLLANLQAPLPTNLPPAFHTEAWASLQLWSQLGAWSEFGHMRKVPYIGPGNQEFDPFHHGAQGAVAPYPDFFGGLAKLSRQMASATENAGLDEKYDEKAVARKLLDACSAIAGFRGQPEPAVVGSAAAMAQLNDFVTAYAARNSFGRGIREPPNGPQLYSEFIAVARRCIDGADSTDDDKAILKKFFDARITLPRLLNEFANCCDKLAELARKNIEGASMTVDDEQWIAGYGALLEHFYQGSDDSYSLSTLRKLDGQKTGQIRWAGLGNCASLYIILPSKGRYQIYRGAVLTYREFNKAESDKFDDKTWRDLTAKGDVPAPPAFTLAFRAEKNVPDILDEIAFETSNPAAESYRDTPELLQELRSRAKDTDVPALVEALPKIGLEGDPGVADGVAACVAALNWRDKQGDIVRVMKQDEGARAKTAASILFTHPEWVDGNMICAAYTNSSPASRVVCAGLLGRISQTPQTRSVLLRALNDDAAAVRWAAVFSIDAAHWKISEKIPPLLERLNDSNCYIAAASAFVLGNIRATNAAPVLFTNLQQRLQDPQPDALAASEQYAAVLNDMPRSAGLAESNFYDPYQLLSRAQNGMAARRVPTMEEREPFTLVGALIEALGKLHYQPATQLFLDSLSGKNAAPAAHALKILAPDKLLPRLIAVAGDKTAAVANRDQALLLLGEVGSPDAAAAIVPLLDDRTGVPGFRPMPGRDWRVCDRAALTVAALLGRQLRMAPMMPTEMRDQQIEQVRQWVKAAY